MIQSTSGDDLFDGAFVPANGAREITLSYEEFLSKRVIRTLATHPDVEGIARAFVISMFDGFTQHYAIRAARIRRLESQSESQKHSSDLKHVTHAIYLSAPIQLIKVPKK
ncbi:MAG: hypothetical protein R3B54_09910 [Bdellovibrionota bacterium]